MQLLIINSNFQGLFAKTFNLKPPLCFWFIWIFKGLFWVCILVNVNFEIVFTIGIPTFRCLFYKRFIFEAVVPLSNDPIMSKRLIQSFRHLEHQNMSISSESIDWAKCGKIFGSNFGHQGVSGATFKWSHHVGEIDMVILTPWTSKYVHYFIFYRQK